MIEVIKNRNKEVKMKKYELISEPNTNLRRVVALIDIPAIGVHKKDHGGMIESENNLSHDGNCWVSGDALVYGNALVYGDALVYGNARVYGDALVYGNARVYGNALVYGDAWVSSPLYIQGSRFALTNCKYGYIQIGCECHSFKEWEKLGVGIAKKNGFTKEQIDEYREYIKLFRKIGK